VQSVFHAVCLHLENEVPVQFEDRYVNPERRAELPRSGFQRSCRRGEYLVQNVPFDEIEHVVDAVLPTPEQAAAPADRGF
jgi:GntR family histidine utilization transcriptional repressor